MPYRSVAELPPAVKKLPKGAQDIYMGAFNGAFKTYDGNEQKSHATAWARVKDKYKQVDGQWVSREAVHAHGDHVCVCPKCDTEVTVPANVKCNTQECPECGVPMQAKQAGEGKLTKEAVMPDMSAEDKRQALNAALRAQYKVDVPTPIPGDMWVRDVFDAEMVYSVNDQLYKAPYTVAEDGTVTIGEPVKVVQQTIYNAVESLRSAYQGLVQEVGKRNALLDAKRIKEILRLCQELLSNEPPDEDEVKKAIKKVEETRVWVREQAVTKTEDGQDFPAAAYAYVPDAEKSSTWKLRLWEDPTQKVTRKQLGAAAAALSPGGFRGQKVQIPSSDMAGVKRKIRTAYRSLDVPDDEMPRWVKESETREILTNFVPLTEAKLDKGRAHVIVIKAGFNAGKDRYYPVDVLRRDYKIFEGAKMYADHPSQSEEHDRPERSIKDWVGKLTNVECDEAGTVTGIAEVIESWLQQKLASLRDKQMLSEMGISIDAVGNASKAEIEGIRTLAVESLLRARSVDFVTEAGAGGAVTLYEADRGQDVDLIELGALKDRRPDLVTAIEAAARTKYQQEAKHIMEQEEKIAELTETIATLTTEKEALVTAAQEAEKAKLIAETKAIVEAAVGKADLPEAAKTRVLAKYAEATSGDGLEEAIKAEADYVAEIRGSGKVKGLGESKVSTEAGRAALRESFKTSHPEWTDAQLETAVNGR